MVLLGSTIGPRLRAFPAVGFAFLMFVLRLAKRGCSQRATAFVQESLPPQACCQMQECSRARVRGACLSQRRHPTESEFKNGKTPLSRRHVSVGRPETCWSERRPRHCDRGPRRAAAAAEARFTPKTTPDRSRAAICTTDDSRWAYWNFLKFQLGLHFHRARVLARGPARVRQGKIDEQ